MKKLLQLTKDYKEKSVTLNKGLEVLWNSSTASLEDPLVEGLKIIDPEFYDLLTDYLYGGVYRITYKGEEFDYENGGDTEFLRYINKVYFKSSPPQNDETI